MTDPADLRRRAQALRGAGQTAEADRLLQQAITDHPDDIPLRIEQSIVARVLGDHPRSLAISAAVLAEHPRNHAALVERLEALHQTRDYPAALAAVGALAAASGESALVALRRGQCLRGMGDVARAAAVLGAAIPRYPADLQLKTELAAICRSLGETAACVALCEAVLADAPANRNAHLTRIEVLAAARAFGAAHEAIAAARAHLPDEAVLALREVQLLRAEGRMAEAAAAGEDGLARHPRDIHLRLDLAGTHRALGNHGRAVELAEAVLADDAASRWAHLARIEALIAAGRHDTARAAITDARARLSDDPQLDAREAQLLRAQGRLAEAAALGEAALLRHPRDTHLRLDLAGSLRALGQHDRAALLAADVLADDPANRWALLSRIEALTAAGRSAEARAAIAAAATLLPDDPLLPLREAQLLRAEGRLAEAVAVAEAALVRHPHDPGLKNDLAATLRSLGRMDSAAALTDSVLAGDPANRGALSGRVEALVQTADAAAILAEVARLAPKALSGPPDAAALATDLLIRLLPALPAGLAAGPLADLQPALAAALPRLTAGQAWALYRRADEVGLGRTLGFLCDALFDGRQVGAQEAGEILRTLQQAGDPSWDRIGADLATRMRPDQAGPFRLDLAAQTGDAAMALRQRKALLGAPRDQTAVRAIAQVLMQDGCPATAARYLRRALPRLPDGTGLVPHLVSALMQTGCDAEARALVAAHADRMREGGPGRQAMLAGCLLHTGQAEEACAVIDAITVPAHRRPQRSNHARALISLGRIDEAAAVFADLKATPQRRDELHAAPSLTGVLMVESLLSGPASGAGDLPVPQAIAAVAAWRAAPPGPPASGAIPRSVAQFWDNPAPPPGIVSIMDSWRDLPGFAYRRFHARSARAWIADALGPDWMAAWRMARTPTEQSDFFRLCLLMVEGGIYADADDRLHGDLSAFCDRVAGLTLYAETFGGALGNNLILTPPPAPRHRLGRAGRPPRAGRTAQ